jgi:hypothetical protein
MDTIIEKFETNKIYLEQLNHEPLKFEVIVQTCMESDPPVYEMTGTLNFTSKNCILKTTINAWNIVELEQKLYQAMFDFIPSRI